MAIYLDKLFATGHGLDWGIVGAGVLAANVTMRENLRVQDWLTTVVELDPTALTARVACSMIDFLPIDLAAIMAALVDPRIRIVSLTITEGGYYLDAATGGLAVDHPEIRADAENPEAPKTIFGLMIKALAARKAAGIPPFSVLSCDNLPGNGNLTRQTVTTLARLSDPVIADWIEADVAFPNSMVDCITPATTVRERTLVEERFGVVDLAPVVCEPFRQWVIEDRFPSGRPALESVGVEFVEDVAGYELMKLRILNAGHAAICYASALLGHHFVHDAMADPDILGWLRALQVREAIPTLKPLAGVDYTAYLDKVIARFANPEIGDTIPRLAQGGSDRQPKFILPTLQDALDAGGAIDGLALEIALWCRYCMGADEAGRPIKLEDTRAAELMRLATNAVERPKAFLQNPEVFGRLGEDPRFADAFNHWLGRLLEVGVRATLQNYVSG
ncbi:mannitol 2-dehydrogenase [Labrys miyagiensis]|uniref:Mannitol 2-dehydrogenase n=2 Tax=Labrys miyagiensis TaxID=346912 RepID=A0ABQ6CPY3_9HYPH|nr:mannitol 2-dehydrogenase [Labrys miyagiensis]